MKLKLAFVTHYTYPSISATQGIVLPQFKAPLQKSWSLGIVEHFRSIRQSSESEAGKFCMGRWFVFSIY